MESSPLQSFSGPFLRKVARSSLPAKETKHRPEVIQKIAFDKLEGRYILNEKLLSSAAWPLPGKSQDDASVKEFSGAPLMFYFNVLLI